MAAEPHVASISEVARPLGKASVVVRSPIVDPDLRRPYNAAFSDEFYARYLESLAAEVGPSPFRIAETPVFVPKDLRDWIEQAAIEVLAQLSDPVRIAKMSRAIPKEHDAPGIDALPNCVQVDFAIVRGPSGRLEGRIVELQGFPSLYAFTLVQARVLGELAGSMPGMPRDFSVFFGGWDRESATKLLARTILAGEDPEEVVLLDLDPPRQKTVPDFVATKKLLGIDAVCPTTLVREGRKLYREKDGRRVPVRRIFNRIVFDELDRKKPRLPFAFTDELDVSWCPHPNWYWIWSKYSLPLLDHVAVPRARLVSELERTPDDLSRYVLKPLFSFAGAGVKVDPTRADIEGLSETDRAAWVIQEKIEYARELLMPDGNGVAAEMRVMCLRAPDEPRPRPVWNLVRLSRGKMLGVDQNRDMTWVGSSVGMWPL